jgi:hypothetical protein
VILKAWGIDVILGMDWLREYDGVIHCREKSVLCKMVRSGQPTGVLILVV